MVVTVAKEMEIGGFGAAYEMNCRYGADTKEFSDTNWLSLPRVLAKTLCLESELSIAIH